MTTRKTPPKPEPDTEDVLTVSVRLDRQQVKELDILRAGTGRTRSAVIREIVATHLKKAK